MPGYKVAGKTGTAAKPDPQGGYSTTKYVASFVGIVPATNPRLVILVTIDEPAASIWGGVVAAPAFQQIAGFDLQYLEIPPDDPVDASSLSSSAGRIARLGAAPVELSRIAETLSPSQIVGDTAVEISDLAYDTRAVTPGALFFCVRGARFDGHELADRAIDAGAAGSSSSGPWPRVCRRSSSRTRGARWRSPRSSSSSTRPTSSRSPPSPGRTGRRRPRSCSTRSSRPRAASRACSGRSSRESAARHGRRFARRPRRSTSSAPSARCSTRATAAPRWRRRRTAPSSGASTGSASRRSRSRT